MWVWWQVEDPVKSKTSTRAASIDQYKQCHQTGRQDGARFPADPKQLSPELAAIDRPICTSDLREASCMVPLPVVAVTPSHFPDVPRRPPLQERKRARWST